MLARTYAMEYFKIPIPTGDEAKSTALRVVLVMAFHDVFARLGFEA
jgi:hypothetical protein